MDKMPYWPTQPTEAEIPGRIEEMREWHKAQLAKGHGLGRHQDNGGLRLVKKVYKVNGRQASETE